MLQKKERQKKAIKMAKIVIILINDAHLFNASFSPTQPHNSSSFYLKYIFIIIELSLK